MYLKNLLKQIPSRTTLAAFILALAIIFSFFPANPTQGGSVLPTKNIASSPISVRASSSLPVRLMIPKIKVNAAFEYVGLTKQGAVGVPKNFSNVAWFNLSSLPGNSGSAVIAGHYGIKNRKASVFDNLYKLRPGDKIYVKDSKGATVTFVVRAIKSYSPQASVPELFSLNDGKAHLNLITCEGTWSSAKKSYSKRLVIFTDKE